MTYTHFKDGERQISKHWQYRHASFILIDAKRFFPFMLA